MIIETPESLAISALHKYLRNTQFGWMRSSPNNDLNFLNEVGINNGKNRCDTFTFYQSYFLGGDRHDPSNFMSNKLVGYEIKTKTDTLKRLPQQIESYNKTFDMTYLVIADNHFKKLLKMDIPEQVGIIKFDSDTLEMEMYKVAGLNDTPKPERIIELLPFKYLNELINDLYYNLKEREIKRYPKFEQTRFILGNFIGERFIKYLIDDILNPKYYNYPEWVVIDNFYDTFSIPLFNYQLQHRASITMFRLDPNKYK